MSHSTFEEGSGKEDAKEATKAKIRTAKRTHLVILREEGEGLTQTDVSCLADPFLRLLPAHLAWPAWPVRRGVFFKMRAALQSHGETLSCN